MNYPDCWWQFSDEFFGAVWYLEHLFLVRNFQDFGYIKATTLADHANMMLMGAEIAR